MPLIESDTAHIETRNFIRRKTVEQNERLKRLSAGMTNSKIADCIAFYAVNEVLKVSNIDSILFNTLKADVNYTAPNRYYITTRIKSNTVNTVFLKHNF